MFCDASYMTLLHMSTRWLNLEMVVSRILRLYNALRSYFGSIHKYKPSLDDFETYLMNDVTMYHFLCKNVFGLSQADTVARNMRMFQILLFICFDVPVL